MRDMLSDEEAKHYISMKEVRIKQLISKLQPYVNGKLITNVFVKYWEELLELIKYTTEELKAYEYGVEEGYI